MHKPVLMKTALTSFLLCTVAMTAHAGNGGGMKSNLAGSTTNSAPATSQTSTASAPVTGDPQRSSQIKQVETFVRSVLPAILAAENGDDNSLEFIKDKVTYFETLQRTCSAAKANHVETTASIKKLDPSDISIDPVKNEARVNVIGNLITAGTSTPTLWVVNVKITSTAAQPFAISQIIASKLPGQG